MTHTTTPPTVRESHAPSGFRRGCDTTYVVLSIVFLAAVLVQFFLAGYGAYAPHHGPHAVRHAFGAHEDLGNYLGIFSVLLFVIALLARTSRRVVLCAFVVALLTEPAQHALAQVGKDHRWVGGLHAVDGLIILVLAIVVAISGYRRLSGGER